MGLHTASLISEKRFSCPPAAVHFAGVEEEIDMDLKKLSVDCRAARQAALKASEHTDDEGTCNLDATVLRLEKGARSRAIVAAIEAAGLSARETQWIGRGIMIQPPGDGQANRRYVANEALYKALHEAGWSVTLYYQMD